MDADYDEVKRFVREATRRFGETTRNKDRGWRIDTRKEVTEFYGFDLAFERGTEGLRSRAVEVRYDDETVLRLDYGSPFAEPDVEMRDGLWQGEFDRLLAGGSAALELYGERLEKTKEF